VNLFSMHSSGLLSPTKEILIGIISNFLFFLFGLIGAKVIKIINTNYWNFWGYIKQDKKRKISVAVSTLESKGSIEPYPRLLTGLGELKAYGYIQEAITRSGIPKINLTVTFSKNFPDSDWNGNIIAIGGAQFNDVVKKLSKNDLPFDIKNTDTEKFVFDIKNNIKYHSKFEVTESYPEMPQCTLDYGILTKMSNEHDKQKYVIICRGAHTFGVAACGRMLSSEYVKAIAKAEKKISSKSWQALIKAVVYGEEVIPSIVDIRPVI
jgi:hypothetical protein